MIKLIGRYNQTEDGLIVFDAPGFIIQFSVFRTSQILVHLSSVGNMSNVFWVYLDDLLYNNMTVSPSSSDQNITISNLDKSSHTIRILKITEADYNQPYPQSNYITLKSIEIDSGNFVESPKALDRRIEFIGDSLTAGFCSICPANNNSSYASEAYAYSWAYLTSANLTSEYHTTGQP